ncbi:MAG TPA: VCBS repeat-containing protein, partial [Pyrinomonadaceae bacterium]|nr:VCBS repeat-containing protein [Pyrinomonadaceae bacterium]
HSYLYINVGNGVSGKRIPFGPNDPEIRMRASQAADLNRDGLMDIVVIDERRGALIFFGEKGPKFSNPVPITSAAATPYALMIGDLNGDGLIDIVVGNVEAPSVVYFNDGTGRHLTPVTFGDNKGTVYGFAIGDLDGDGLQDIAAARSEAPNVVYFGGL